MKLRIKVLVRMETEDGKQIYPTPEKFSHDDYATIISNCIAFQEKHEMLASIRRVMESVMFITEKIRRLF